MQHLVCILRLGVPSIPFFLEALGRAAANPVPGRIIRRWWTAEPFTGVPEFERTQDEGYLDSPALLKVAPLRGIHGYLLFCNDQSWLPSSVDQPSPAVKLLPRLPPSPRPTEPAPARCLPAGLAGSAALRALAERGAGLSGVWWTLREVAFGLDIFFLVPDKASRWECR